MREKDKLMSLWEKGPDALKIDEIVDKLGEFRDIVSGKIKTIEQSMKNSFKLKKEEKKRKIYTYDEKRRRFVSTLLLAVKKMQ